MLNSGTDRLRAAARLFLWLAAWILWPMSADADQFADSTWAGVKRYIAVHPGTSEAVWEGASQALVTNGLVEMTPVGDGTYRSWVQLTPGATYNFLFFAKTDANPPLGLKPNVTYYDAVPSGGNIHSGTEPYKPTKYDTTEQAPVRYGAIGLNFDARRVIAVPSTLSAGDSFYVYANFADRPITIKNFDANPVDTTSARLTWEAPYGNWGQGGESLKAADVIAGGTVTIYRNTSGSTTVYSLLKQIPGSDTSYLDTGLTANTTYYYVLTCNDAYRGSNLDTVFSRLISDTTSQDSSTPKAPVRIRFKVHHLDWEYVSKNDYEVHLTPPGEDPWFGRRMKGVIRRVDL